jgi:hypothetical protein
MPKFVLTYRMPTNRPPGGPDVMDAWNRWFQSLGDRLVDFGNPVFERTTVGDCGGGTELGGYSIVSADDIAAAIDLAKSCPVLRENGGVEVGLLTELDRS